MPLALLPRTLLLLALLAGTLPLARAAALPGDDVEAEGPITDLGNFTVTVGGYTFTVTGETEIRGDDGDLTFEDLAVGLFVEIEGYYDDDDVLIAERIDVEDDGEDVETEGAITDLGFNTVTVGGLTFRVTANTEIRGDDGDLTFEDLTVGLFVEVRGHYLGSDLLADRIDVEDDGGGGGGQTEVVLEGPIQALGSQTLTVQNRLFAVTADTEIVDEFGAPMAFGELAVGMGVLARGLTDGGPDPVQATLVVVLDGSPVGIAEELPAAAFALAPVAPNPAAATARLRFALEAPAHVTLTVTDGLGRTVRRLLDASTAAGVHEVPLDASSLPTGVYLVRLTVAGAGAAVQRITVVR